ncbi:zinc-dependent metalloprotease family protein [Planctomycetes bacterium TBK1r]|uniref:Matrixin n=1 Tax=Stieleria magnilauensis TaxID=2527963 RepID=A0ABX5XPE3_9BACT|nr:Matrixin [Planctomycetes bacterium TBK1r]
MANKKNESDLKDLLQYLIKQLDDSGLVNDIGRVDSEDQGASKSRRSQRKVHQIGKNTICSTDARGFPTADDVSPSSILLDASEGFVPLWRYGTTLRWWFDDVAISDHPDPSSVKRTVRELMTEAMEAWGDAAPIKLREERDSYDFRVIVNAKDRCTPSGCTLASAFFPDSGRHDFHVYPLALEQSRKEQVDTFIHELGHVFGLRHFFAQVSEQAWPSEIFGNHRAFSIMNYGSLSELTEDDRNDLKRLYQAVWSGALADINGTPIRLFPPYHEAGNMVIPRFYGSRAATEG